MSTKPANTPIPFAPGWDQSRWEQLFKLEELLREVVTIDHGSNVLARLSRCIELAEDLGTWDIRGRHQSLVSFLKEQALVREGQDMALNLHEVARLNTHLSRMIDLAEQNTLLTDAEVEDIEEARRILKP